jgi:hypothetical protein
VKRKVRITDTSKVTLSPGGKQIPPEAFVPAGDGKRNQNHRAILIYDTAAPANSQTLEHLSISTSELSKTTTDATLRFPAAKDIVQARLTRTTDGLP